MDPMESENSMTVQNIPFLFLQDVNTNSILEENSERVDLYMTFLNWRLVQIFFMSEELKEPDSEWKLEVNGFPWCNCIASVNKYEFECKYIKSSNMTSDLTDPQNIVSLLDLQTKVYGNTLELCRSVLFSPFYSIGAKNFDTVSFIMDEVAFAKGYIEQVFSFLFLKMIRINILTFTDENSEPRFFYECVVSGNQAYLKIQKMQEVFTRTYNEFLIFDLRRFSLITVDESNKNKRSFEDEDQEAKSFNEQLLKRYC
ncbi:hypothetical protein [Carp edema virus]|nr:hypothetical protein [Carp edema virus]